MYTILVSYVVFPYNDNRCYTDYFCTMGTFRSKHRAEKYINDNFSAIRKKVTDCKGENITVLPVVLAIDSL